MPNMDVSSPGKDDVEYVLSVEAEAMPPPPPPP